MDLRENSKIWPKMKNFEIFFVVYMDKNVIDDNIKKNFKIFYFLAKILSWRANTHFDEKKFCCKMFCLQ